MFPGSTESTTGMKWVFDKIRTTFHKFLRNVTETSQFIRNSYQLTSFYMITYKFWGIWFCYYYIGFTSKLNKKITSQEFFQKTIS